MTPNYAKQRPPFGGRSLFGTNQTMTYTHSPHLYFRYFLLAFCLYLLFPTAYYFQPHAGLDPSYIIATHLAYKYNLVFGKDIVFPFGPLAILNERFPIAINRWVFLLFDGYFLVSLFFPLRVVIQKLSGYGPILFFFLSALLALNEPPFQWFFLLFVFYLFGFLKEPSGIFPIAQAGLLSLFCLFYKVNLGLPAIVLCIAVLLYALYRRKISLLRFAIILFSYLGCLLILAWLLQVDLKGYIAGSLQLIAAYSDAMFMPAGHYTLFLIAALLIFLLVFSRSIYLLVLFFRKRDERGDADELIAYGITAVLLFILYKSSFVRMDNYHMSHFFHIAGLVPAGLYAFSQPGPARKRAAIYCWIILGVCIVAANTIPRLEHPYLSSELIRHLSIRKIGNYYQGIKDYDEASAARQEPANEWKKIIGDHTADIIPMEISKIYFAGLRYDPRPVIQSYSAYNRWLDSLNYEKYLSPGAPDYVLFSLESIDHRYAFFDESRTKMAIFSHYQVAGEVGGDLLLQKKALTPLRKEAEDAIDGQLGADIPIVSRYDLQYSRIFVRYSLWGRIKRFLYQPPALTITFKLDNGDSLTYPAISTMLADGIILNKYVDIRQDFQLLMQSGGRAGATIKQIRINEDPDNRGFEQGIRMVNSYYSVPLKPEPERREDSLGVAAISREYNSYIPSPVNPSLYTRDSFRCSIEQLRTYSPLIRIQGWAEREIAGEDHTNLKAVLRKGDTVYELPTEKYSREDVKALAKNAVGGGFIARVSRVLLPAGSYQIGIVIGDTVSRTKWVRYTDQRITIH
jgi:hypothetical protein